MKLLVLNGPNMNMLGIREPEIYGHTTHDDLVAMIVRHAKKEGISVEVKQSNSEGQLMDWIQKAYGKIDGIIINPAAYTHTSIGILDAITSVSIPTVEVHISDLSAREEFRQFSYIEPAVVKTITGEGLQGYLMAMDYLKAYITENMSE